MFGVFTVAAREPYGRCSVSPTIAANKDRKYRQLGVRPRCHAGLQCPVCCCHLPGRICRSNRVPDAILKEPKVPEEVSAGNLRLSRPRLASCCGRRNAPVAQIDCGQWRQKRRAECVAVAGGAVLVSRTLRLPRRNADDWRRPGSEVESAKLPFRNTDEIRGAIFPAGLLGHAVGGQLLYPIFHGAAVEV